MKGTRKKTALSPEKKADRKQAKTAAKAEFLASSALAKLPADKAKRDELFTEAEKLKKEQQSLSGKISQQKKRMTEVFGMTPLAIEIRKKLLDAPDGVYEATCKQIALFLRDANRPWQLDFLENLEPGKGPTELDEPVFDGTDAGREQRADDPGRARKAQTNGGPPPAPTEGLPLDEAEEKFSEQLRKQNEQVEKEIKARSGGKNPLGDGAQGTGTYRIQ